MNFFHIFFILFILFFQSGQEEVLETDIQINRQIVAAAQKLANDKSANRSVRKKRRKDFQLAAQKLYGLEKGLYELRTSSSKPDISDFDTISQGARSRGGSGFSLNNMSELVLHLKQLKIFKKVLL